MSTRTQQRKSMSERTFRTVRYEEASAGKAPIPITAEMRESARNAMPVEQQQLSQPNSPARRPMTAPAVRQSPRISQFSGHLKRDSAIATSPKSPSSNKLPQTLRPGTSGVVQSPSPEDGWKPPRTSFTARRSRKAAAAAAAAKQDQSARDTPTPEIKRLSSFKGLQTDIPTGGLEDLDADNFGFSHRGSIFFGGAKLEDLFGPTSRREEPVVKAGTHLEQQQQQQQQHHVMNEEPSPVKEESATQEWPLVSQSTLTTASSIPAVPSIPIIIEPATLRTVPPQDTTVLQAPAHPVAHHQANDKQEGEQSEEVVGATPRMLVAGKRKPSVQMLQAAIAGGRVLSAEEITFSMKVRSMYDAGDESGADWSSPGFAASSRQATPDTSATKSSIDDNGAISAAEDKSVISKSPREGTFSRASRLSQDIRASYHTKSDHELAGGIEDWQNLESNDVDRYGFIVLGRKANGDRPTSSLAAEMAPGEGLHRVATGLRLVADQPRRRGLRRTASNARSSRSVPPQASIRPSSLHSATSQATSTKSRRSTFRGRQRRLMDAAGDMLTLPPGLADIAEQQDEGQALAQLRRREWSRNEKWQKMARPIQDSVKASGGGMLFDFDTDDPKLISRTWKGIPDRWRATAWHSFLSTSARRRGNFESDASLVQQFRQLQHVNCADDYQIDVDVPRTISMHVMFRRRYRGGQRLLFRVLHAIALHSPETGYVQGMASLAATLLCYFDEERAFVMMVRLWQLRGLEQLFQPGFGGLMTALKELEEQWLAGSDVARKLNELSIASTSWGTRWYLTLFNMSIPFQAQLRVWDVFMLLGDAAPVGKGAFGGADLDVLHATSAALIDATREIIVDSDFENAMKVLTSFVPIRDDDLLMRVARAEWKLHVGKKRKNHVSHAGQ